LDLAAWWQPFRPRLDLDNLRWWLDNGNQNAACCLNMFNRSRLKCGLCFCDDGVFRIGAVKVGTGINFIAFPELSDARTDGFDNSPRASRKGPRSLAMVTQTAFGILEKTSNGPVKSIWSTRGKTEPMRSWVLGRAWFMIL